MTVVYTQLYKFIKIYFGKMYQVPTTYLRSGFTLPSG